MSDPVTLEIPVDAAYRELAPDLAVKYAELAGSPELDGRALSDALRQALGDVVNGAPPDASVTFTLQGGAGGIEVAVRCGDRVVTVRQPAPARKS